MTSTEDILKSLEPEGSALANLQMKIWDLDYSLKKIIDDYPSFNSDLYWSRYGEVVMVRKNIKELQGHLNFLYGKLTTGTKE